MTRTRNILTGAAICFFICLPTALTGQEPGKPQPAADEAGARRFQILDSDAKQILPLLQLDGKGGRP